MYKEISKRTFEEKKEEKKKKTKEKKKKKNIQPLSLKNVTRTQVRINEVIKRSTSRLVGRRAKEVRIGGVLETYIFTWLMERVLRNG